MVGLNDLLDHLSLCKDRKSGKDKSKSLEQTKTYFMQEVGFENETPE